MKLKLQSVLLLLILLNFKSYGKVNDKLALICNPIDTLYYNSEWKVVSSKEIADYYRIRNNSYMQFRDYYITGELQGKGGFTYMDSISDANTVLDGKCINYYKNGNISDERTFIDGKLSGAYIEYEENGLIKSQASFVNDKMHGIYTQYYEDGMCVQSNYIDGIADDFYNVISADGCCIKYDRKTNKPIWESPSISELLTDYKDGDALYYYLKNGVGVAIKVESVSDYGRYHKVTLILDNNSFETIDFNPVSSITATIKNSNLGIILGEVLSSEEYIKKVKRTQNWEAALNGISEGLSTSNAGYITSTTKTNTTSKGSAYAYSGNNTAYGSYSGKAEATTETVQYSQDLADQVNMQSNKRIQNFESLLLEERKYKEQGYLKRTTIHPKDIISGYVNIKRKSKDESISVTVDINGAKYLFEISL